jgi:hypothetical protein
MEDYDLPRECGDCGAYLACRQRKDALEAVMN